MNHEDSLMAVLGRLRSHHDHATHALYRQGKRNGVDFEDIARDPELIYHLDVSDAITAYFDREHCDA